ncbi:MAG: hypothetical protein M0C28_48600 [Candidatus Moduliflexus flocculans]|nr:hypothetical protein [Candidatus Moduliflexus flocculans]
MLASAALAEVLREFGVETGPREFEARLYARRSAGITDAAREAGNPLARGGRGGHPGAPDRAVPPGGAGSWGRPGRRCSTPPVPCPGRRTCWTRPARSGLALGIVSNAQYYTEPALEAAFGRSLAILGFVAGPLRLVLAAGPGQARPELFPRSWPGLLQERRIRPGRGGLLGNDLLNDVVPGPGRRARHGPRSPGTPGPRRLRAGDARAEGVLAGHGASVPCPGARGGIRAWPGRDPFRSRSGGVRRESHRLRVWHESPGAADSLMATNDPGSVRAQARSGIPRGPEDGPMYLTKARDIKRIGFVATRLQGTDGVSLETGKRDDVLTRARDYETFSFPACPTGVPSCSRVVPAAYFLQPEVHALHKEIFRDASRRRGPDRGRGGDQGRDQIGAVQVHRRLRHRPSHPRERPGHSHAHPPGPGHHGARWRRRRFPPSHIITTSSGNGPVS